MGCISEAQIRKYDDLEVGDLVVDWLVWEDGDNNPLLTYLGRVGGGNVNVFWNSDIENLFFDAFPYRRYVLLSTMLL